MAQGDKNDLHNLDDLDTRLYKRNRVSGPRTRRFDSLKPRTFASKADWKTVKESTKKAKKFAEHPSFFKRFFLFSIGFVVLALLIAGFTFFTGGNTVSNANIQINVLGNSFASGGEELPLQVEIVNENSAELELADLFVEYEKGGDASSGAGIVRDLYSLGSIGAGKTETKNLFLTLFGEEGSTKNIDLTLQYRIRGSNAIFVKESTFPVTIRSAPITLSVEGPENTSPNQKLTFKVKVQSNSKTPLNGLIARIEYPSGFRFESASPDAFAFNNVFSLGDLAPGAERIITITGTVFGQDGEDRAFRIYTGAASEKDKTTIGLTYNSMLHLVSLTRPFIGARLTINGSNEAQVPVSSSGDVLVNVNWENNLPSRVTDAEIRVALSGNALDPNSVKSTNGFYDSSSQSIIWNRTTEDDLASIEPSDRGTLSFTFKPKALWQAGQSVVSRPSVLISVSIKGKQAELGGAVNEVTNFEEKTAVINSDLGFAANAYYTSGPFQNTGPVPPRVGTPTTYTITWTLTNSANTLSDATATAILPTYVEWVGMINPNSEPLEYDSSTRTIRWKVGQVASGAGITASARLVSFQLRLNPSSSQKGTVPRIILETSISAKDTFTGQTLSTSRSGLTTQLDNDAGFPPGGGVVQ